MRARCTVTFIDGEQLKFVWERPEDSAVTAGGLIEKALANQSLAVELEGRLVVIPANNVRTIEILPAPKSLPKAVIRGARLA
jgi:hypothetical protein